MCFFLLLLLFLRSFVLLHGRRQCPMAIQGLGKRRSGPRFGVYVFFFLPYNWMRSAYAHTETHTHTQESITGLSCPTLVCALDNRENNIHLSHFFIFFLFLDNILLICCCCPPAGIVLLVKYRVAVPYLFLNSSTRMEIQNGRFFFWLVVLISFFFPIAQLFP